MIHYLTGNSEVHIKEVLTGLYEATIGVSLEINPETGEKHIPQNDGRMQFHYLFPDWIITPGVPDPLKPGQWLTQPKLKSGFHCALGIISSKENPLGVIGPNDTAMLQAAGIEVLREDEIDPAQLALLPKFQ